MLLAPVSHAIPAREIPTQAEWLQAMQTARALDLPGKVMRTRVLFSNIAWSPDDDPDGHWSTPAELLRRGSGDMLDLVTAYYFTLRGMGVPAQDIRMFFGRKRTLYDPVSHILLAVRSPEGMTYFIDPLRGNAMTDETPAEFRPSLAFNEQGAWRTGALTDLSIWSSVGADPGNVPRWLGVCYSALGLMGMLQPLAQPQPQSQAYVDVSVLDTDPPASGGRQAKAKRKPRGKAKPAVH
jgi:hypothetical protein